MRRSGWKGAEASHESGIPRHAIGAHSSLAPTAPPNVAPSGCTLATAVTHRQGSSMTHARFAIVLSLLCLAFGCATTQPMSDAQRRAIRSVSVAKNVVVPEYPKVIGPSLTGAMMLLGPLALAAMASSTNPDAVQFKKFLDDNKIDLKEIVRQEFVARLSSTRTFPAIVDEGGDARFDLAIEDYGLAPGFSMSVDKPLRPLLLLTARLSTADGKILWQNAASIAATDSEIEARRFQDILDDPPQRSREAFSKAIQIVVHKLLDDLGPNQASAGSSASVPQPVAGPLSPVTPASLAARGASAVSTHAADSRPAEALPMVGASWQYAYTMRGVGNARFNFGVRVSGVVGDVVHEVITLPSAPERIISVGANSLSLRSLQLPQSQTLVELAPYLHAILAKNEPRSWSALAGYPTGNDATLAAWVLTVRETGQEEVTVPAGTFDTTVIEVSGRRARTPPTVYLQLQHESARFRLRAWYSPQVRRYVRLQHETWPLSGAPPGVQLVELTGYAGK